MDQETTQLQISRRSWLRWMFATGVSMALPLRHALAVSKYEFINVRVAIHPENPAILFDPAKCIYCGACKVVCNRKMAVDGFYDLARTGDVPICVYCGQCSTVCEGDAITIRPEWQTVREAKAAGKKVIISTSPAVRVGLADAFGGKPGQYQQAQVVALLRQLGADVVFDVGFGADITITEEAAELLERLKTGKALPMFTSCCPSWVAFCEFFYPALLPQISRVKSPIAMQGATIKSYYAAKHNLDPKQIFNVALTPCPAKKYEIARSELNVDGLRDMDAIVTVRELPHWLAAEGVTYDSTKTSNYDALMGEASSAGILFGNTGGVTETVLRTAYVLANGKLPPADFFSLTEVRGLLPSRVKVKTAKVQLLPNRAITVAVVQGLANARAVIKLLNEGTLQADFIEVMACEGGCVGGAGMPLSKIQPYVSKAMRQARLDALQAQDTEKTALQQRVSWCNPPLRQLYDEFYKAPASETAQRYLHTTYTSRANQLDVTP